MATIYSATEPDEGDEDLPPREVDLDKIERGVRLILEGVGEDLQRPGLQRTPERVAEMYAELTAGMREDARERLLQDVSEDLRRHVVNVRLDNRQLFIFDSDAFINNIIGRTLGFADEHAQNVREVFVLARARAVARAL